MLVCTRLLQPSCPVVLCASTRASTLAPACSLMVAMETALEDGRYDEAARLRDEFKALRKAQQLSSSEVAPDHL